MFVAWMVIVGMSMTPMAKSCAHRRKYTETGKKYQLIRWLEVLVAVRDGSKREHFAVLAQGERPYELRMSDRMRLC
jgi:hypothetical protein